MSSVKFQVQVRGDFGGAVGGWRPACTGTENQTRTSDDAASTFDDAASAEAYADHLRTTYTDDRDDESGHTSPDRETRFRVVTVAGRAASR